MLIGHGEIMRKVLTAVVPIVVLAACVANRNEPAIPPNYRDLVVSELRSSLKDPYSVRDAQISQPTGILGTQGICVRFNAKNSFGAYTGLQTEAFVFSGGQARQVISSCGDASYSPFVELESSAAPGAVTNSAIGR
jgi:hypothetical protein